MTEKQRDVPRKKEYYEVNNNRTKHMESVLVSRGVDRVNFLSPSNTFEFSTTLVRIAADIPNVVCQSIPVKKQYAVTQSLLNHPLRGKYVLGVSSFPSDLRAKQFAIMLMRNTIQHQILKKHKGDYPLWHKVDGSYRDKLRDGEEALHISMLILSGFTPESTPVKIEKLRDILEKYSTIPRVVVVAGVDPITFFANKLHFPLTAGIYFGPDNRVREV